MNGTAVNCGLVAPVVAFYPDRLRVSADHSLITQVGYKRLTQDVLPQTYF